MGEGEGREKQKGQIRVRSQKNPVEWYLVSQVNATDLRANKKTASYKGRGLGFGAGLVVRRAVREADALHLLFFEKEHDRLVVYAVEYVDVEP